MSLKSDASDWVHVSLKEASLQHVPWNHVFWRNEHRAQGGRRERERDTNVDRPTEDNTSFFLFSTDVSVVLSVGLWAQAER